MSTPRHIAVVVLGDLGRSPRMQFHALALANSGFKVSLIGYRGESVLASVEGHAGIDLCHLRDGEMDWAPWILAAPLRLIALTFGLFITLVFKVRHWDTVLVQTPPALPTLPISWLASRLKGALLVVDWHNLGFLRFGERVGEGALLQRVYRQFEAFWGRRGDRHITVSITMSTWLKEHFSISECHVLYDRPLEEQLDGGEEMSRADLFKQLNIEPAGPDQEDPIIIVSSTSWSDDEDPTMLLKAGHQLDEWVSGEQKERETIIFITGKGPNREAFEKEVARHPMSNVHFMTGWLSTETYRTLLRQADLGVCLHLSASGIDLPMKLADMMGAGLPVACFEYSATLKERFREGEHGVLFQTDAELFDALIHCYDIGPDKHLRSVAMKEESWESGWTREALPIFESGR